MAFGRDELIQYAADSFGTEPEYLWTRLPDAFVLRNSSGGKWFAVTMPVRRDRLGLAGTEKVDVLNVKCGELLLGSLLGQLLARGMKTIATVFNTLAIVAFVPGLGLYRCMELFARGEMEAGARAGIGAMMSIVMIALGIGVGTFLFRAVFVRHRA